MMQSHVLTDGFRAEWSLYCEDYPEPGPVYKVEQAGDLVPFGGVPGAAEIRLLADIEPRLCVFLVRRTKAGWDVIPVSPFRNPATNGEALIGRHVYQVWNRQTISAKRVSRSWKVAAISEEECKELHAVVDHVEKGEALPGYLKPALGEAIRSRQDERLRYLEDFGVEVSEMKFAKKAPRREATGRPSGPCVSFCWPSRLKRALYSPVVEDHEYALAAADGPGASSVALFTESLPKSSAQFNQKAFECILQSEFMSLLPDDDERRPLVYTWASETPEAWKAGPLRVAAYVKKTGALFGRGTVDVAARRIVDGDFRGIGLKTPIEKVSDIMLIVAPAGKSVQ